MKRITITIVIALLCLLFVLEIANAQTGGNFSDHFEGTTLNASYWTAGLWTGGSYAPLVGSSVMTIEHVAEGAWVRSLGTYTHGTLSVTAEIGASAYQLIGFASDGFADNRYFAFGTMGTSTNLYARVNNNSGEENYSVGLIPTGMHNYRIEWTVLDANTDNVEFFVDDVSQVIIDVTNVGASLFYVYLSKGSTYTGNAPLQVDYAYVSTPGGEPTPTPTSTPTNTPTNTPTSTPTSTPTNTPTPTSTPTQTPTPTPGPSSTPWTTPTAIPTPEGLDFVQYGMFGMSQYGMSGMSQSGSSLGVLSLPSLDDFQDAVDVISDTTNNVDLIVNTIDTRVDVNVLKVRGYSPFAFARAILILLDDFEWLGILFWWFIAAFCVIMSVTAIRLVVSLWGIIDRIISLIKLIPFIGVLVLFVFVAQPAHAQTATPPPTPTATPIPDYVVQDYHFIYPQTSVTDTQWTPAGGASWGFSKWTIPISGSISQYVNPAILDGTHPFSITIKAQATTTSTFRVVAGGITQTLTITRVGQFSHGYSYTTTFGLPSTVIVETVSGGPVVVDSIALVPQDIAYAGMAETWEHSMVTPRGLNLGDFVDWFLPIETHTVFTWDITESSWFYWFTTYTGPVAATMMQFMTPRIIHMYVAFRITLMCVLWFMGFVMQKIGKPIPPASDAQPINIGGMNFGYTRYNWSKLPSLGPSSGILRGGGSRRGRRGRRSRGDLF